MKNVLLILVDSLRADRCVKNKGCDNSTFINYLIKNGVTFSQAISTTSFTTPCVASILTGVYPFVHGVEWFCGNKLNPHNPTLAELLQKKNFSTCAMVTGPLAPSLGLNRGFDKYLYRDENMTIFSRFRKNVENFIEKAKKPWFLFLHLWELHYPIFLPKKLGKKYDLSLNKYDIAFSYLSNELMSVLHEIDLDKTIIILHSDHGEQLPGNFETILRNLLAFLRRNVNEGVWFLLQKKAYELFPFLRAKQGHGYHLYEPLIRVPLIFVGDDFPRNRTIDTLVSQVDIAPTVLDSLGLLENSQLHFDGMSLIPLINGEKRQERVIYIGPAGVFDTSADNRSSWIEGLRTSKWKYISLYNRSTPLELYNLEEDPKESINLVEKEKEMTLKFKEELRKIKKTKLALKAFRMSKEDEEKIKERLRALGYVD
jgi:arylsulfatase A-like enzyme